MVTTDLNIWQCSCVRVFYFVETQVICWVWCKKKRGAHIVSQHLDVSPQLDEAIFVRRHSAVKTSSSSQPADAKKGETKTQTYRTLYLICNRLTSVYHKASALGELLTAR